MLQEHQNIIHINAVLETDHHFFLMMELAENGDLWEYISNHGYFSVEECCYLFSRLCSAINYCHQEGIVHRDIKCSNILIDSQMQVKIGGKFM